MSTTNISDLSYDFETKFLDIASKYYKLADISTLKLGMFGYSTEVLAHIAKDGTFHRNFLYNEYFINTANLYTSVYNWAKILEQPIDLAQPSKIIAALTIPIDAVEAKLVVQNNIKIFTISRKTTFSVGGKKFLLPHDLQIIFNRTTNTNNVAVTALYDTSSSNYIDTSITSPYIKTMITGNDLTLAINLYQLEIQEFNYNVLSDDILERSIYEIPFKGSLASFNVFYNENQTATAVYEPLTPIFNDIVDTTEQKYAFYSPVNENTLRVYFSTKAGFFKPAFNSKLKMEILVTSGSDSNFKYNGAITLNAGNSSILSNVRYSCVAISDAVGGTSTDSLKSIKLKLINRLRTRKSITTTYDLKTLFEEIESSSNIADSNLIAIKTRDDFISRNFSVYTMLRDNNNAVVPTNTVDLSFTIAEIENFGYSLKPGMLLIYDRTLDKYRLLSNAEIPDYYLNDNDSYIFSIPFLMNIDFKEFPKVSYFHTNFDNTYPLHYNFVNINVKYEVVINSLEMVRNSLIDINRYVMKCTLNSSIITESSLKVRVTLYKDGIAIGYADMTRNSTTSEFYLEIFTDDNFDENGNYFIRDTFTDFSGSVIPEFAINGNLEFTIGVLYQDPNVTSVLQSPYDKMPDILGAGSYVVAAELSPKTNINIAESLSDIVKSTISIDTNTGVVHIKRVPIISSRFFLNNKLNSEISRSIYLFMNHLRSSISRLENNTSLDLKFFNTSGVSKTFSTDTTDLSFKMQIKLNEPVTVEIDRSIRKAIIEFVESTNNQQSFNFAISNLSTYLENTFDQIVWHKVTSLNGSNVQTVYKVDDFKEDVYPKTYVPEFLTVKKINGTDSEGNDYLYNIDIKYI